MMHRRLGRSPGASDRLCSRLVQASSKFISLFSSQPLSIGPRTILYCPRRHLLYLRRLARTGRSEPAWSGWKWRVHECSRRSWWFYRVGSFFIIWYENFFQLLCVIDVSFVWWARGGDANVLPANRAGNEFHYGWLNRPNESINKAWDCGNVFEAFI